MILHSVILQIFHPFIQSPSNMASHRLASFASEDSTPLTVFCASVSQLKRLIYIFHTKYKAPTWSVYLSPPTVQLCDAVLTLRTRQNPIDRRAYFLLCIRTFVDLHVSFPVFSEMAKGFLARAMRDGMMSSEEAKALRGILERHGAHHLLPEKLVSGIIIDFETAARNPENATARILAERFDELAVHDEFTTGIFEDEEEHDP
jgi:hypothetical protein